MKIAIDVTPSIYVGTGVGTYYNNLIPQLLKLGREHEFILFGYSLRQRGALKLANKTFPFPPSVMEVVWNRMHKFPIESLIGDCDLIHTWDYIQPPTKRAKIVTTIHDLTPLKYPEHQHQKTISAYKSALHWVKKEETFIITDSISSKKDLVEMLNISNNIIEVIYLAPGQKFHEFRKRIMESGKHSIQRLKNRYNLEGDYILSVGTREPRKNLPKIIEAFKFLKSKQTLVIAGNVGWGEKVMPTKGVKLIGFVPETDLPALYAGASCLVYPSLYEGFGLPILEAMAVGCPVVASNRGSLKEITGDAAIQVNPENVEAIAFGIKTALEQRSELVEKGIKQASKFSWVKTAMQTLKVYEKVYSSE